ncbi:hypothetical protein FRC02_001328 [Tulasnella sp. 418]|nr:hypothetical protein FRC02_001328 [Tulasnella sp. 418]
MLSDSDDDDSDLHQLTINEHYAKAFSYKKEREELAKCLSADRSLITLLFCSARLTNVILTVKEKYGSDFDEGDLEEEEETDSESDETEDEDGEDLTPAVDAALFKTLALIRNKDPSIYNSDKAIFQEQQKKTSELQTTSKSSKDKSKPVTYRQQAFSDLLGKPDSSTHLPTHVEEQEQLRSETVSAFHQAIADDEEDDLLILREKTKDEIEKEEEEYKEYLEKEVGDVRKLVWVDENPAEETRLEIPTETVEESRQAKQKPRRKGEKRTKETDQEFLVNYILNRGWIDRSTKRLPTYNEVTSAKKKRKRDEETMEVEEKEEVQEEEKPKLDVDDIEVEEARKEEDDFDDLADNFEASFNFRFEEPGGSDILRHPRQIDTLVRRKENPRKAARERRNQRKEEELQQKKEEVRRLKRLKVKEIREKLDKVGKEGGWTTAALEELDLEADWDPEAHDRQMAGLYDDEEFYAEADEKKPTWEDDIDIEDFVPSESTSKSKNKKKKKKDEDNTMDEGGVDEKDMDADAQPSVFQDDEEWDGTEAMRKRKVAQYMDEVYKLDFNDMVAGMPTRFKYTTVAPQSYSLSSAEILMATDQELNEFISLKKLAPYRRSKMKDWDPKRAEKVKELKQAIATRGKGGWNTKSTDGTNGEDRKPKKRKGKKERMKAREEKEKEMSASHETIPQVPERVEDGDTSPHKKKRRKRNKGDAALV